MAEARCPSCRAARADLHAAPLAAGPQTVVLLALLALVLLAVLLHARLG
ncbi:MAG: hypothetical protein ABJA34_01690 [Pseudonocardiales bacterium]